VNEEQKAGLHNYKLGSAIGERNYGLASGIYFYQMKANNFIQHKKMIMVK